MVAILPPQPNIHSELRNKQPAGSSSEGLNSPASTQVSITHRISKSLELKKIHHVLSFACQRYGVNHTDLAGAGASGPSTQRARISVLRFLRFT